ncbi:hypothetical protein [Atlantibacter sp.]|nr:hypothetical protein [Atlantibacter sp.]
MLRTEPAGCLCPAPPGQRVSIPCRNTMQLAVASAFTTLAIKQPVF